jgi:hypothetical protein
MIVIHPVASLARLDRRAARPGKGVLPVPFDQRARAVRRKM